MTSKSTENWTKKLFSYYNNLQELYDNTGKVKNVVHRRVSFIENFIVNMFAMQSINDNPL